MTGPIHRSSSLDHHPDGLDAPETAAIIAAVSIQNPGKRLTPKRPVRKVIRVGTVPKSSHLDVHFQTAERDLAAAIEAGDDGARMVAESWLSELRLMRDMHDLGIDDPAERKRHLRKVIRVGTVPKASNLDEQTQDAERESADAVKARDVGRVLAADARLRRLRLEGKLNDRGIIDPDQRRRHFKHLDHMINIGSAGVRQFHDEMSSDTGRIKEGRAKARKKIEQERDAAEAIKFEVSPGELAFAVHAQRVVQAQSPQLRVHKTARAVHHTSPHLVPAERSQAPPAAEMVPPSPDEDGDPPLPALIPASRTSVDFAEAVGGEPRSIRIQPKHLAVPPPVQGEQAKNRERPADIPADSLLSFDEKFGRSKRAQWVAALGEAVGFENMDADDFEPSPTWTFRAWWERTQSGSFNEYQALVGARGDGRDLAGDL